MWILYFNNKPHSWFAGDSSYTIGRQNTDVVVLDDPSISRVHLTLHVGLSVVDCVWPQDADGRWIEPDPYSKRPPLQFTDSSKYGSTIQVLPRAADGSPTKGSPVVASSDLTTKLTNNVPFLVPSNASQLLLQLGTHGSQFLLSWEPLKICTKNVPVEYATKVENRVARCGYISVPDAAHCDVLVSMSVEPTPDVVIALCSAKPIVSMQFFESVLNRSSCLVPVPNPSEERFVPPLDSFWEGLMEVESTKLRELFCPRPERKFLFADLTFVCVQRSLFDEVSEYLTMAHGHVLLDEALDRYTAEVEHQPQQQHTGRRPSRKEQENMTLLNAFCHRHQHHLILFTLSEACLLPSIPNFVETLEREHLKLVEYTLVLKSIIAIRKLVPGPRTSRSTMGMGLNNCMSEVDLLTAGSSSTTTTTNPRQDLLTRCETEGDAMIVHSTPQREAPPRKTAQILFDDDSADADASKKRLREESDAEVAAWRSKEDLVVAQQDVQSSSHTDLDDDGAERVEIVTELKLPRFPCFRMYRGANAMQSSTSCSGKPFQKQLLTVSARYCEFEPMAAPPMDAAHALTRRTAAIDANDLFSSVADVGLKHETFNTFDDAEMLRSRRQPKAKKTSAAPVVVGTAVAPSVPPPSVLRVAGAAVNRTRAAPPEVLEDIDVMSTIVARDKKKPAQPFNIFDTDALF